ncbi:hypothetical protein [Haliea sp.]|uniref:hypothetical protein n=1 Tax=Haliea sp. TaxID=1932666 RepID=UPI00352904F3
MNTLRERIEDMLQGADEASLQADCARLQQACAAALQQRDPGQPLPANAHEAKQQLETAGEALMPANPSWTRKTAGWRNSAPNLPAPRPACIRPALR